MSKYAAYVPDASKPLVIRPVFVNTRQPEPGKLQIEIVGEVEGVSANKDDLRSVAVSMNMVDHLLRLGFAKQDDPKYGTSYKTPDWKLWLQISKTADGLSVVKVEKAAGKGGRFPAPVKLSEAEVKALDAETVRLFGDSIAEVEKRASTQDWSPESRASLVATLHISRGKIAAAKYGLNMR